MKKVHFAAMLLISIGFSCNSKPKPSQITSHFNSGDVGKKELDKYIVDSCLENLFQSVANSNDKVYASETFFYSITYQKSSTQRYLKIEPQAFKSSRYTNFEGGCKIGRNVFLLRGDIDNDPLFRKQVNSTLTVDFSVSSDTTPFIEDPILDGYFGGCNGQPIYMEVFAREEISGYERFFRRNK